MVDSSPPALPPDVTIYYLYLLPDSSEVPHVSIQVNLSNLVCGILY